MSKPVKERLDLALVRRGLVESREQAKRLIMAGEVRVGTEIWDKPSAAIAVDREIYLAQKARFVGRGGLKLEAALDEFRISAKGKRCFDAGASTGGFTDCLLQRGAALVHAYDVGTNQLAWKLRQDPRVISREQFNVRYLKPTDLGEEVDLVVLDLSFISLTQVLPACWGIMAQDGDCICLIKPQFELSRGLVGKGGIVRDESLRQEAPAKVRHFAQSQLAAIWAGLIDSPITGGDGNREFLAWLRKEPLPSGAPQD